MKKAFCTLFILMIFFECLMAQAPHSFKYQAVARDNLGKILDNRLVGLKISILKDSPIGTVLYVETHQKVTNQFGIVTVDIGAGTIVSGNFNSIDWANGTYFVKTDLDIAQTGNYEFIGTSQLLAVPYAVYANEAGKAKNDADTSATNELQTLNLTGTTLTISNGNSVTLPTDNDNQTLTLTSNTLSISNGNSVNLTPDSDHDTLNEIQVLSKTSNTITLSKNGGSVTDSDNQTLALNGNQLQISGGNSITLSGTVDLDADPTNELQAITISHDTIFLSNGGFVKLPQQATGAGIGGSVNINAISNQTDTIIRLRQFGNNSYEMIYSVCGDENGNIYLAGSFNGSYLSFLDTVLSNSGTGYQSYIAKITSTGNFLWALTTSGTSENNVLHIAVSPNGNISATGTYFGQINLGGMTLNNSFTGASNKNIFVALIDNAGQVQWLKQIEGRKEENNCKIDINNSMIVVTGEFKSDTLSFNGNTMLNHDTITYNSQDIFVVAYDYFGTVLWYKNIGSRTTETKPDVIFNIVGDIFLSGTTGAWASNPCYVDTFEIVTYSFLVKISPIGNVIFVKSWPMYGGASSICSDDNYVYFSDEFTSNFTIFGFNLNYAGGRDIYSAVYDFNGNCISVKSVGGFGYDYNNSIIAFNNKYYIGAQFQKNIIIEGQYVTSMYSQNGVAGTPLVLNYTNLGSLNSFKDIKMQNYGSPSFVLKTKENGTYKCYVIFGTEGEMLVNNKPYGNGWYLMKY